MITNNPELAGQEAAAPILFDNDRFTLYPVNTRFEGLAWFVTDAMSVDRETGGPAIVIQAESKEKALESLVIWKKLKGGIHAKH